jgi:hypothetical protein
MDKEGSYAPSPNVPVRRITHMFMRGTVGSIELGAPEKLIPCAHVHGEQHIAVNDSV